MPKTISDKGAGRCQIWVFPEDRERLLALAQEWGLSMPLVVNKILEERKIDKSEN
jgi:hypothetical protein